MATSKPIEIVGTKKDNKIYLQLHQITYNKKYKAVNQIQYFAEDINGEFIEVNVHDLQKVKPGEYDWFEVMA